MKTATNDKQQQVIKKTVPRKDNSLDDAYVAAYCNAPISGKTAALLTAGYAGKNAPQEAYRMHKRLQQRIYDRTSERIANLDNLAASQLETILATDIDTVGYANMARAIQQGMDYAGRKQADTHIIKQAVMTSDERQEAIQVLQDRLKLDSNVTIN